MTSESQRKAFEWHVGVLNIFKSFKKKIIKINMSKLVHSNHVDIYISNVAIINYDIIIFFKLMSQSLITILNFKKLQYRSR